MSQTDGLASLNNRAQRARRTRQVPPPRHQPKAVERGETQELPSEEIAPEPVAIERKPVPPRRSKDTTTKRLVNESLTYDRRTHFLRPDQSQRIKARVRALPDGLSGSDIVRYALDRLEESGLTDAELEAELIKRALDDAEHFGGRKNRGLPPTKN